jgi:hypothetical protein
VGVPRLSDDGGLESVTVAMTEPISFRTQRQIGGSSSRRRGDLDAKNDAAQRMSINIARRSGRSTYNARSTSTFDVERQNHATLIERRYR